MYKPSHSVVTTAVPDLRLLLQGAPGTGKTTFACKFPNPFIVDFDHKAPAGIDSVPFWNDDFLSAMQKVKGNVQPKHDVLYFWLKNELPKFEREQTVILDSWTMIQNEIEIAVRQEPEHAGNKFHLHARRAEISRAICGLIKRAKCQIIVTCHEVEIWKQGEATGKLRPLQTGQFGAEIAGHFTDYWRTHVDPVDRDVATGNPKKTADSKISRLRGYYCQLIADDECECITNPVLGEKARAKSIYYMPSTYEAYKGIYE